MTTPWGSLGFEDPQYLWAVLGLIPVIGLTWISRRKVSRARRITMVVLRSLLWLIVVFAIAGLTRMVPTEALGVVHRHLQP